jgi:hypothetical protein
MMLIADRRLVGAALLVFAIIPFGDMSIVWVGRVEVASVLHARALGQLNLLEVFQQIGVATL